MKKHYLITIPTLAAGGMERVAINTAKQILNEGNEVTFFLLCSNEVYYDIPQGANVIYGKKDINNKLGMAKSLLKLRSTYKKIKPFCVLSFSSKHSSYVILALSFFKPNIFVLHRSNPHTIYGKVNNWLNEHLFPNASALIVQTKTAKEYFCKKYNTENVFIYPNPVRDVIEYIPQMAEDIIVTVGRLSKEKGINDLIEIFAYIGNKDWKLLIVGDGPERNNLEELARKFNIQEQVEFIGFTKNVDNYLKRAKIFAFASKTEGFPNALLEAMCTGVPCISYDCPTGPADIIINTKNGYLIELNNKTEYQKHLQLLMENEDIRERFSTEAKKLKDKHRPDVIVKEFLENIDLFSKSN